MPFIEHLMGTGVPPFQATATAGGGATGLVAVGNSAGTALQLSASWNAITTSSGSTGVILPKASGGFCGIRNDSGQTISVYPPTGSTINAAASSVTLGNALSMLCFQTSATTWASITSA